MAIASERATDTLTGAEAAVEMLKAHGVEIVFGLCGDTSLPFYDALARLPHGMRHVLTRDERSPPTWRTVTRVSSGKVGVCEGPSGGGATYILPGLVEANESSVPVLVHQYRHLGHRARTLHADRAGPGGAHAAGDQMEHGARPCADIPRAFRAAFNEMTTGRPGAAHIALPFDVQNGPVERAEVWADADFGPLPGRRVAADASVVELAAKLHCEDAESPLFICGGGVVHRRRGAGAARSSPRTSRRAGRDHHQRQGLDRRDASAGGRRGRLQRRHARDARGGRCRRIW